ncbi:MAG: succinate dehydrogenase [Planctomycetes bacterium]|nr:succinate dehydrogenase [Planctomycetota bacterium]
MTTAVATPQASFIDRNYHLIRRLHSLSGVFPIGLFLIPHLTTNSSIVWGGLLNKAKFADRGIDASGAGVATFQHEVDFIHGLPALIFIEIFVLWLPIAFHAAVGVWFARTGRFNTTRYAYQDNWRYVWQRVSGYVGVLFIFMHISSLRWGWTYGGLMPGFEADAAASSLATHLQRGSLGMVMAGFYLLCVLGLVFHFANGLWTAAITWGLTISVGAQRRWGQVCTAIGLGLGAAAATAVFGFATLDPDAAREVEAKYRQPTVEVNEQVEINLSRAAERPSITGEGEQQ